MPSSTNPPLLETVSYVTTYRGAPLDPSLKSITITLVFRSPTDTLTGEQVESAVQKVIESARSSLGAAVRT